MTRDGFRRYWQETKAHYQGAQGHNVKAKTWKRRGEALVVDLKWSRHLRLPKEMRQDMTIPVKDRQIQVFWHPEREEVVARYYLENAGPPRVLATGYDAVLLVEKYGQFSTSDLMGLSVLLLSS